ncbi:MAG: TolC family protein, partial [Ignavibacteria bacterium]
EESFNFENFDVKKIVDYAFEHRSDLKALKYKILMNETELELSELNRYPDFNLRLGYRILPFEENNAFSIMFGITLPFAPWSSDKYKFKVQRDKINIKSSTEEFEAKRNEIQNEVINTVNTLQSARESMKYSYYVLLPQTENSLKSTQYNYENNLTSYLDLLDSYKMYQESKLMFYESLNMYMNAIIELEKITGMNFKNSALKHGN